MDQPAENGVGDRAGSGTALCKTTGRKRKAAAAEGWRATNCESPRRSRLILPRGSFNIYACGSALTKAAYEVVGTTSRGRLFEGCVVNGFWCLLMPDHPGGEVFEKVVLEDEQGRALHTS